MKFVTNRKFLQGVTPAL